MNIFFLDMDTRAAARAHTDKHVLKMILETAQLLSQAWHVMDNTAVTKIPMTPPKWRIGSGYIYGCTHEHHPMAKWVRESEANYQWLWNLGMDLLDEYDYRWQRETKHGTFAVMDALGDVPRYLPSDEWTTPPQCMPDAFKDPDLVTAYRNYYRGAKLNGMHAPELLYTRRGVPEWAKE